MTSFLVIDTGGSFVEHSVALAKKGKNKVYYWTDDETSYPKFRDYAVGLGMEYLTKEEKDWVEYVKRVDVIVNFDVCNQGIIELLRGFGYKCFGSGKGRILENDRVKLKEMLKDAGLMVQNYEVVKGICDLEKYIDEHPNVFVKINRFRGDLNSFYAKNLSTVQTILEDMESTLGPFRDDFTFVVEDCIDTDLEFGFDGFFNGVTYLRPYFLGIEYQKNCYLAKVTDELPSQIEETMQKIKPYLQKYDWRGGISTEEKIVSETEHYFLDICARLFFPGSAFYTEAIRNWPEVVEAIANKRMIRVDVREKYWGCIPLATDYGSDHFVPVEIEDRSSAKLELGCCKDGQYYSVPGYGDTVRIIAGGDSIDEVIEKLKEKVKEVDAYGLSTSMVSGIDKIKEIAEAGKKVGIDF